MLLVIYMQIDKIFENFISNVKKDGVYASSEDVREATRLMLDIIKAHKDASIEELIDLVISDNINLVESIRSKYYFPGYTIGVNVGNINVKLLGGSLRENGPKMDNNALFDIASVTKFYTQIVIYNLIKEGKFSFDSVIYDLDDRFVNLKDLTVRDITSFSTTFMTDGRINDKKTTDDAFRALYTVRVDKKGTYNYNDIGMMIMKEVMERVTCIKYKDLVDKYIISKFGLKNTYLIVPDEKKHLVTSTPNFDIPSINDSNANALGGYSGHAGIFASSDDLISLSKEVISGNVIDKDMINDIYTPGYRPGRAMMGNVYVADETGLINGYNDVLEPKKSFSLNGSTRSLLNASKFGSGTVLLNPASMSIERALETEARINEERVLNGKSPLSLVKRFTFDDNGDVRKFTLVDVRQMVPSNEGLNPILNMNAKLMLRLRFLNEFIDAYDKNYNKEINVTKCM